MFFTYLVYNVTLLGGQRLLQPPQGNYFRTGRQTDGAIRHVPSVHGGLLLVFVKIRCQNSELFVDD